MSAPLEKRVEALESELSKIREEVESFRVFFKETIEHYDRLLPERLAIQQKRAKARGLT